MRLPKGVAVNRGMFDELIYRGFQLTNAETGPSIWIAGYEGFGVNLMDNKVFTSLRDAMKQIDEWLEIAARF